MAGGYLPQDLGSTLLSYQFAKKDIKKNGQYKDDIVVEKTLLIKFITIRFPTLSFNNLLIFTEGILNLSLSEIIY